MTRCGPGRTWAAGFLVLTAPVLTALVLRALVVTALVLTALLLTALAACSADSPAVRAPLAAGSAEIRAAVAVVNAAAASPAEQRAALASVTYPAGRPALGRCADTSRTVRFEPVLTAITTAPAFTDADGHTPPGMVLAVPTLVRVYDADALVTTEVTLLHVGVQDGAALFSPLCLG